MIKLNLPKVKAMLLTGGADTRILLSCMSQEQRNKLLYKTVDTPYWSNTNNDSLIAKEIAEAFHLHHQTYSFEDQEIKKRTEYPQSKQETQYTIYDNNVRWISGKFGSELFGGASFDRSLNLDYVFSERVDVLKNKLLQSLITSYNYEKIGSPWQRLNQKILSVNSINKEGAFISQMLLRSQFTSIYSRSNYNNFIIPSASYFLGPMFPYIDTRIIDFFLKCPREFILNYSLYEYIFIHISEKKLIKIPFHSNMIKFVESLQKAGNEPVLKNVGTESKCNYKEYFKTNFSPSLFKGTFLEKLPSADEHKIPEPFLSRICDLTCFLLELQKR